MKVTVLNGSPKGAVSVTMQYVEYLRRRFPAHEFTVHHVAHRIGRLERNAAAFSEVMDDVRASEAVLWAFPLYILLVCSQYKRFIELIRERHARDAFAGRYAAALSTSINYFDVTAHNYVRAVNDDLGLRFVGSYSANMNDLHSETERKRLTLFAADLVQAVADRRVTTRRYAPLPPAPARLGTPPSAVSLRHSRRVVILTDRRPNEPPDSNLAKMLSHLRSVFGEKTRLVSLYDVTIRDADVLVFAGTIVDRQLSWKWRQFFDRSFFNTHTPSLTNKQIAFVVSGPAGYLPDVREVYEAWVELQESHLVDVISDEGDSGDVYASLASLAERMVRYAEQGYVRPRTFLGIGGMKIFRDDIFGGLRIPFPADHRAYRKRGYYDFPTRRPLRRLVIAAVTALLRLRFAREAFLSRIKTAMVSRFRGVIEATQPYERAATEDVAYTPVSTGRSSRFPHSTHEPS